MEDDDVDFWREEAKQCDVSGQRDRYAEGGDLDLSEKRETVRIGRIVRR